MGNNPSRHNRQSRRDKEYDYSCEGAYFVTICSHQSEYIFGFIKNGKMFLNEFGKICNNEWINTPIIRPNIELITHVVMPNHFHALFIIKQKSNQRYVNVARDASERHTRGEMERHHRGVSQYAPLMSPAFAGYARDGSPTLDGCSPNASPTLDDVDTNDNNDFIEFTYQSQYAPLTENEINEIRKMPHSPSQTVGAIVRGFKGAVTKQINILRGTPQIPVWQRNYHEYIITDARFFNNVANYILQNPARWRK